jgi:NADPH:quinone reductase
VQIGVLGGARATLNMMPVLQRRLTITGSTLRARPVAEKGAIARDVERHVWPLIESGSVRPVVHASFPLEAAADAHACMEASTHIGKLILQVQSTAHL